jgi:hypothetical protein
MFIKRIHILLEIFNTNNKIKYLIELTTHIPKFKGLFVPIFFLNQQTLKISYKQIRFRFGMANSIKTHLWLKIPPRSQHNTKPKR